LRVKGDEISKVLGYIAFLFGLQLVEATENFLIAREIFEFEHLEHDLNDL
jgi:hypothetical protein